MDKIRALESPLGLTFLDTEDDSQKVFPKDTPQVMMAQVFAHIVNRDFLGV